MKIKNITGVTRLFDLGRRSQELAANQILKTDDDVKTQEAVGRHVEAGSLQLIEPPRASNALYTRPTPVTFAVKTGALARWADGDILTMCGVVFEVDTNSTITTGRIAVTDDLGDLPGLETSFDTSFLAAEEELAAVGITYVGKKTLGGATTYVFNLDTDVTSLVTFAAAFTNAGGSGTAPSVIKPAALSHIAPQQVCVDAVVPSGATKVVFTLPCTQILGIPVVAVFDGSGLAVAYSTTPTISGQTVELTSLTAGYVVTIIAWVR